MSQILIISLLLPLAASANAMGNDIREGRSECLALLLIVPTNPHQPILYLA